LKFNILFLYIFFFNLKSEAFDIKIKIFSNLKSKQAIIESSYPLKNNISDCNNRKIKVKTNSSNLEIECGKIHKIKTKLEINSNNLLSIEINGKKRFYTDKIIITNENGILSLINQIELEKYLKAVVKDETQDLSNFQTYKAQAVVARTYTLANIKRHISKGYNLCDTTHCQLYRGFSDIKEEIEKAVDETKGEILTYRGKPIWAFYHSICGGRTEDVSYIWQQEPKPYLKQVEDGPLLGKPYCFKAKGFKWRTKIGTKTFKKFLKKKIIKPEEEFKDIQIEKTSPTGRVLELLILTDKRTKKISGIDFYHIIGREISWDAIRSTKFKIYYEKDFIVFEGYGHGHGIGMCQNGADEMARLGYDYKKILNHYYKNVKIIKFEVEGGK